MKTDMTPSEQADAIIEEFKTVEVVVALDDEVHSGLMMDLAAKRCAAIRVQSNIDLLKKLRDEFDPMFSWTYAKQINLYESILTIIKSK